MEQVIDQAWQLRQIKEGKLSYANVISITSGKGGVGKSNFALNFAIALGKLNNKVLLLDADLGLANIDILLNRFFKYNLSHFVSGIKKIEEVIYPIAGGIDFIPGASGISDIVNMSDETKRSIIKQLEFLENKYDVIIVDTQAGVSSNVLSFVLASDTIFMIVCAEPTSLTDAYSMIKMIVNRKHHARIYIVVNMVNSFSEGKAVYTRLHEVVKKYLKKEIELGGIIPFDNNVKISITRKRPYLLEFPRTQASYALREIAKKFSIRDNAVEFSPVAQHTPQTFFRKILNFIGVKNA